MTRTANYDGPDTAAITCPDPECGAENVYEDHWSITAPERCAECDEPLTPEQTQCTTSNESTQP